MQGPEQSHSSQGSAGSSGGGGRSSNRVVTLVGAGVLIAGTVAALMQPTRPNALTQSALMSLDWWRYPVERNAGQRMAVSKGPLNAVYARRGTDDVWFAGDGGLVVRSTDGGRTWQSVNLNATPEVVQDAPTLPPSAKKASIRSRRPAGLAVPMSFVSFEQQQQYPQQQQQQVLPTLTKVPYVSGLAYASAVAKIREAGLRVGGTEYVSGTRMIEGNVMQSMPASGTSVPIGSTVRLTVSGADPAQQKRPPQDSAASPAANSVATAPAFYPSFTGICLTSSGTGWLIGARGAAFRTTDDGATWSQVSTRTQATLSAIACSETLGAVAVGEDVVLLMRRDSGTAELRSVEGRRREVSIVRGAIVARNQLTDRVERSSDTGRTWVADAALGARSGPVSFSDSLNGFAGAGIDGLSKSTDGGATWQRKLSCSFGVNDSSKRSMRALYAASNTVAIAIDGTDQLWGTRDDWNSCAPYVAFRAYSVRLAPASEDVWYAVSGGAFRSDDGGRTWQSLINTRRFASLHFLDSVHAIAGVDNGLVARTSNGGASWTYFRVDSQHTDAPVFLTARNARELTAYIKPLRYKSKDGGESWSRQSSPDSVVPLLYVDEQRGWGRTTDSIYATRDGGQSWARANPTGLLAGLTNVFDLQPLSLSTAKDRNGVAQLWVVAEGGSLTHYNGTKWDSLASRMLAVSAVTTSYMFGLDSLGQLIRSEDGGLKWAAVPVGAPRKFPAPWYYGFAALTVAGTLATSRARRRKEGDVEDSIADILVSDRPLREGDRDVLDFGRIAAGLSRFIRNSRTEPPLTIAITGPWGTGKSSLMSLLRRDLERRRFRTIWFNAWHHQREESLLASLLESIRMTATPPVWTPKGMRFRFRLLGKRMTRHAVPVLALLPVFALAIGYILKAPTTRWHDLDAVFSSFVNLFSPGDAGASSANAKGSTDVSQNKTVIALIISIVGTALTYLKGLKAFGVKPDEVAKSVVSAGRVRTIEAQPAFRYRFAQDFSEVTEALKPERIVIFIDDLDRCKPEQVLEILEAINFLAESGDCVVVLGIDRERVTGCVAIGFKEVATVLSETRDKPAAAGIKLDIGAPPVVRKTDIEYQIEYAEHYLEKLLNMEIPIPPATAEGLGDVMTNTAPARGESDATNSAEDSGEAREARRRNARRYLYTGVAAALTLGMFLVGWNGSAWVERMTRSSVAAPVAVIHEKSPEEPSEARNVVARTDSAPPRDTTTASSDANPVLLVEGALPSTAWWLHGLLALAALSVLFWLLTPREDNRVEDSAAFAAALRAWAPVLFEQHRTPRSAKKFLNKMRFLSMAQRAPAERQAPVEQAIARLSGIPWLRKLLSAFERRAETQEVLLPGSIPEVALVSLNVIRDRQPEWLDDPAFWTSDLRKYVEARLKPVPADIERALVALSEIVTPDGGALQNFRWCQKPWERLEVWIRDP